MSAARSHADRVPLRPPWLTPDSLTISSSGFGTYDLSPRDDESDVLCLEQVVDGLVLVLDLSDVGRSEMALVRKHLDRTNHTDVHVLPGDKHKPDASEAKVDGVSSNSSSGGAGGSARSLELGRV